MSSIKYKQWWYECQLISYKNKQIEKNQLAAALVILASEWEKEEKRPYSPKRYWVHPVLQLRHNFGFYEAIFPTLATCDVMFKNYMRMSLDQFESLLHLVGPSITKKYVVRIPIPAGARLAMTLRYLATGDCITSTTYSYLVSLTSAVNIIKETCEVIWNVLIKKVMPAQLTREHWLDIATLFESKWHFPHCIGCIDGKHIAIECPEHAGSKYYNYKNFHSIHLLGVCDYNYKFLFVDIGAPGRASDGGVFQNSLIGYRFRNNLMNLPEPVEITADGSPLPYVLVGDEAFQLSPFLLRPYPGRDLTYEKSIFNYRLSRARRCIENTFGIVVQRWRVLKKPIECCRSNAVKIVKAVVCLHNWLREIDSNNEYMPAELNEHDEQVLRDELQYSAFGDLNLNSSNFSAKDIMDIRDELCSYFNGEGAVTFQYDQV